MTTVSVSAQRAAIDRLVSRIISSFEGPASKPVDAVVAGRALLGFCGAGVVAFAPLLEPDERTWFMLAVISACMASLLAASFIAPWSRLPPVATVVFPALVCAALSALGAFASPGFAAPLSGLLTLCFGYLGLTQLPGTAFLALPVAAATLVSTYGNFSGPVAVRLLIALFIWTVLAELLARLMRRQMTLAASLAGDAHNDELTGVPNRRHLDLRVARTNPGDTLVMCDLDHFKRINDTFGHAAGDRVLADFGNMLRVTLRSGDYCARYGGEEFLLVLPNCTANQARSLLGRLQTQWATLQPTITFSAGVATCRADRSTADTVAVADAMLYASKAAGRDRVTTESDGHSDVEHPLVQQG